MIEFLWLVPILPLAGFLILALFGHEFPERGTGVVGCATIALSALITLGVTIQFAGLGVASLTVSYGDWFRVGGLNPDFAFQLDGLSLLMMLVVTWVGLFIHIFSAGYMHGDPGFARFFAYMNLFVASMLTLVMADNLVLLILGWEGVGLCSYLLIGFWYEKPENGYAARKAFITTRIGAVGLIAATVVIFNSLGTTQIAAVLDAAQSSWLTGEAVAVWVALLLLIAALGKSAQLPLQVWLPDAMAGPTPTSALIHAATMVTAGVYLIARHAVLFELAPGILWMVGALGAATLLVAGVTACFQRDIKRVLAFSTISQIGYMFLALGVGAWTAAMFHFFTHALFKALLFLGAGAIIHAVHNEQDMFRMGGLRKKLPGVFWTFVIGCASLAALPLVTSGFYSKDYILVKTLTSEAGSVWFAAAGILGAALTAFYTARMVGLTFFGEARTEVGHQPGAAMMLPLVVLAVASTFGGFLETPQTLGHITFFQDVLKGALADIPGPYLSLAAEAGLQAGVTGLVIAAIAVAWKRYGRGPEGVPAPDQAGFFARGWGFDDAYEAVLLRPYTQLCRWLRNDVIDGFGNLIAGFVQFFHHVLSLTQSGLLRKYAFGLAGGGLVVLFLVLYL